MTYIRDKSLIGTLTNWVRVIDALPGKCGVSDIDGIIEKNGFFLVLESKNLNEKLPTGQKILLEALSRQPRFVVCIVTMSRVHGDIEGLQRVHKGVIGNNELCDNEEFGELVRGWFEAATKRKPV